MKSNLIFLNLLIDSLWSEDNFLNRVFQVSSPETLRLSRINEYLGCFFGSAGDYIVVPGPIDEKYIELLKLNFNLEKVNFVSVPVPLQNIKEFAADVKNKCRKIESTVFSGISELELKILQELELPLPKSWPKEIEQAKLFNRKDYLIYLSGILNFPLPASEVVMGNQITASNSLFKNLISSGGSGIYSFSELMKIKTWAERKNMAQDWALSKWMKQDVVNRALDVNCYGHSESPEFNLACVKYDQNRLSLQHDLNPVIDTKFEHILRKTYEKVRIHLISQGYSGFFGIDGIMGKDGKLFPVIDLNVRMNKSHVLHQVAKRIKFPRPHISFFRLRFVNKRWLNFQDFWKFIDKEFETIILKSTPSLLIPVEWSYWNLGKSECLMAVTSDSAQSAQDWGAFLLRFTEDQRGQNV